MMELMKAQHSQVIE
jgi:hypothetical protein